MMFKPEMMVASPKYDEYIRDVVRGHEAEIESLIMDTSSRLGEGRTARVSFLNFKEMICVKMFKRPEEIRGVDFYLTASKEQYFLGKLSSLDSPARVPVVYSAYEDTDKNNHDFLMMEALPAVSIDDVLQGRAELPENFDLISFQQDLFDFIEKMHARNIYHRDLHEGNVMIDKETSRVYIIDFGAATEFYGQPERGEKGPYHIFKDGREIILTSDEAMVRNVIRKLRLKLTKAS